MAKKDYYFILGIDPSASQKAIKSAYRQLALKYHPDHNPQNAKAADRFKLIREAYDVLSNADAKRNYDFDYQPRQAQPKRPAAKKKATKTTKRPAAGARKKNLRYNVFVTLEDVARGVEKTIRYIRTVDGEKETIQLNVKIPKGAYHQQRLKVTNFGAEAGDLFVIVHLQNHPLFQVDGLNISVNVPINYLQAAEGATVEVPTLTGVRRIKLRSCDFDNLQYELRGQGLPDLNTGQKGDLVVYCFIEHPKRLNPHQKNALQKALSSWPQGDMMQEYQSYLSRQRRG
ncbi:MAG: J domain-containing protein [Bdellovibrionales bacterium]|nr:DnaJ domain-containing protein [Bdellovibrionales bacterium]NQZ19586.1 J domain-containing protein [Bdellovibrionales bacterium]